MNNIELNNTVGITISKLKKEWKTVRGKVTALSQIDLSIKSGDFFVLLGPSGCGKSTLLNLLSGLDNASHGSIKFGDTYVIDCDRNIMLEPKERNIAMVFQSYALYPHFSVRKNIAFPLTNIRGLLKSDINTQVEDVAKILKITDLLERKPGELSGGQRQRVAIGRALVRKPKVFLMDEPLSNLDAMLRNEMRVQLKTLQKKLGITTIYVTHDQLEAMTLADEIALLNHGVVQQSGTPEEIYNRPNNIFVATFLGSPPMNIVYGKLYNDVYSCGNLKFNVSVDKEQYEGERVALGIRPEHIEIFEGNSEGLLEVNINIVENIGTEFLIHTSIDSHNIIVKTNKKITTETAYIKVPQEHIHLFDEKTQRITIL